MLKKTYVTAVIAAGALCLAAAPAMAQDANDYTKDEQKCEGGMGKELGKEVKKISKCVNKCLKTQRKEVAPDYASCLTLAPTDPCITDPVKGPQAKAAVKIGKKCDPALGKDCPACYPASSVPLGPISCSDGSPMPGRTQSLSLATGLTFYCLEASATTPNKDEAKCEDTAVKEAVKYVASLNKCTDKCTKNIIKGKIGYLDCAPANGAAGVTPSDPDTQECIDKASLKFVDKMNKKCGVTPGDGIRPSCYPADMADLQTLVFGIVQNEGQFVFCGSPSGAFLN